ncbi:serine/threonine-protein kinase [Holotrichia oblita]|uniref:Serine/threonine-protein kinase n=1 Tax=Holotrichia oblita TaxID=644536 RepID=A0ACB9SWU3_HOLOL|nr:serine/threonine-protein kinase [Holotrichia oblita]
MLFCGRRFSFVAPCLLDGTPVLKKNDVPQKSLSTSANNFFEEYELLNILGTGSYSVCRLARHRATGQQYAVKIINKASCDCLEEVEILLRYGHHPGIVSLKGVYEEAGKSERWSHISQHARDLVADMLHVAPQRRPTAAQLVKHPWVNMRAFQVQGNQIGSVITHSQSFYNQNYTGDMPNKKEGPHLKEAVAATFRRSQRHRR